MIFQASPRSLADTVFNKVVISRKAPYLQNTKHQQAQVDICWSLASDMTSGTSLTFIIKPTSPAGWPDKTNKWSARFSRKINAFIKTNSLRIRSNRCVFDKVVVASYQPTCPWLIKPCFCAILFTASRSSLSMWTAHELVKWISPSLSSFVVANPNQARRKTATEACISMYQTLGIDSSYPGTIWYRLPFIFYSYSMRPASFSFGLKCDTVFLIW